LNRRGRDEIDRSKRRGQGWGREEEEGGAEVGRGRGE